MYVILSVSEISHDLSEKRILRRLPPSREFASLCSQRQIKFSVIASMPSEQTCLQGFASDGIHKALAFLIKNVENESFNAQALSAE